MEEVNGKKNEKNSKRIKLIKDKLAKKYDCTVTIEQIIDKDLIGGAVLKVGDKVIDASVRTSLKNLSSTLR